MSPTACYWLIGTVYFLGVMSSLCITWDDLWVIWDRGDPWPWKIQLRWLFWPPLLAVYIFGSLIKFIRMDRARRRRLRHQRRDEKPRKENVYR